MSVRRSILYAGLGVSLVSLSFSLGSWWTQQRFERALLQQNARVTALRDEMARALPNQGTLATGTAGAHPFETSAMAGAPNTAFVDEIKRQIQSEMGLFPVQLMRARRDSFVELNAVNTAGKTSYGTAGYLGEGYFITVKHAVVDLDAFNEAPRRMATITVRYQGRDVPAQIVDSGDATVEVHPGDWAIIKVRSEVDLPPLRINTTYRYDFADPILRLGNDYSKGIILSTGYVGQRTSNGLVTALTDGHPGVSGGGVLDQLGDLVGIPVGRMQGDYRFSFILPLRPEMFRKVPGHVAPEGVRAATE